MWSLDEQSRGARFRSDVMRSLQSTSQSDLAGATPWSRSPYSPREATCPERRAEVARISHTSRSDLLKRRHEVARVLVTPNSLRWPWSDLSERPIKVAPDPERPVGATHQSRSGPLARRHQKSALERPSGATPASRSALFCCRKSWFLEDLFAIYFGRFALGKTYVLNMFCSRQADYLGSIGKYTKTGLRSSSLGFLIVMFLCSCWFLIYFFTWLIWNPIWV